MKRRRHPVVRQPAFRQPAPPDPEAFVRRAAGFRALAVDASSLIVLADIGLLDAAHRTWRLHTVPAVAAEAGAASRDVALLPAVDTPAGNDQALLTAALRAGLPLLTEDRRLLIAAEEADLDCFDVLVALELLLAAGTLDPERHQTARAGLLARNDYRPYRLVWAEAVGCAAAKFIR